MLENAKKVRNNYIERVKEVADDIVNVINCLESDNLWGQEMDDDYAIDILFLIEGGDYEPGVDITEVCDYLSVLVDDRISATKSVIEALEEVFEIDCDPWNFGLTLKGYKKEEK